MGELINLLLKNLEFKIYFIKHTMPTVVEKFQTKRMYDMLLFTKILC